MKRLLFIPFVLIAVCGNAAQQNLNYSTRTSWQTEAAKVQSNFTELYSGKANASCFSDASAFNACFALDWVTAANLGLGTSDNPSFNSVHASGGNIAAANNQVTKAWFTGLSYTADETSVIHGGQHYICTSTHTAGSSTEPGVGASWATVWAVASGSSSDDQTASEVNITDAGSYYTGTTVEAALQEIGLNYALKSNYLALNNTTAFTPDADYEPATKKYVDEAITAGGGYTDEMAQDTVGGMFAGNTETGISITYDDATAKINAVVSTQFDGTQNTTGNAGTATALAANGTNCSAGQSPLGIDASGNAEGCWTPSAESMVYPGAGVPNSTGSAWGTSYTVGTGASNLVQLNTSSQLPAVSGINLTNVTATGLSGTPNITVGTISATGKVTALEFETIRSQTTGAYTDFPEGSNNGNHRVRFKTSDSLDADKDIVNENILQTTDASPDGLSLIAAANYAAMRGLLDLEAGTDFNAYGTIISGASPTVDASGEIALDTTSDQLIYYGGAKRVLSYKGYEPIVIKSPVDADDFLIGPFPYAITLTNVKLVAQGGGSIVITPQICASDTTTCSSLEAITANGGVDSDDGSLSYTAVESGGFIKILSAAPTGTVNFLSGAIYFTVTAD